MSPIVGAFLGGIGSTIPAGYGVVDLTWVTTDGKDLSGVVFTFTGSSSYTVTSDSQGHASIQVAAGTYSVSVTHSGNYTGDGAKTLAIGSRETASLVWYAQRRGPRAVTFTTPYALESDSASYTITNDKGEVVATGSKWLKSMAFSLMGGDDYTLTLSTYGVTKSHPFYVSNDSDYTEDLSSMICYVTVTCRDDTAEFGNILIGPDTAIYPIPDQAFATTHSFPVLRDSDAMRLAGDAQLVSGDVPMYSLYQNNGESTPLSTHPVYDLTLAYSSIRVSTAATTVSTAPSKRGRRLDITSELAGGESKVHITVPKGKYSLLLVGGGGGGGSSVVHKYSSYSRPYAGGGGGSGRVTYVASLVASKDLSTWWMGFGEGGTAGEVGTVGGGGGQTYIRDASSTWAQTWKYTADGGSGGVYGGIGHDDIGLGGLGGQGGAGGSGGGGGGSVYGSGGAGGKGNDGGGGGGATIRDYSESTAGAGGAGKSSSASGKAGTTWTFSGSPANPRVMWGGAGGEYTVVAPMLGTSNVLRGGRGGGTYQVYNKLQGYGYGALGGCGGDSLLGKGGKPAVTQSTDSYYWAGGTKGGPGAGGAGGCASTHSYDGGSGTDGGAGAISILWIGDA